MIKDYAAIATQYARDVADGRVLACKWVKLAAARHLKDLERDAAGWRYTWNPELEMRDPVAEGEARRKYRPADRVCVFAELMPHIKGDWAARRELIQLQAWQVFILCSIFGWVDRVTGRRRIRRADLFVPRKNAKSTLASVIGNYMLAADWEHGAEVYSGATSEKQAGEVFTPARLMFEQSPAMRAKFGVEALTSVITVPATNSRFERLIGKPGDGASPSCGIVDEYHEHSTEDLHDTIKTGMGARSQPLLLVITTAGDDVSGPCYAHQLELQQVLEGVIEDEQRFGIVYMIDLADDKAGIKGDDPYSEEALIKANPNYGVSIDPEFMLGVQRDAQRDPRKQATFLTKHLNVWVASASPWINLFEWQRAADSSLKLEQFKGEEFWRGLDLANTKDIASECKVFIREIGGKEHWYVFWRHYLPEKMIAQPENKHYQGWKRGGWLIETPGGMIDQGKIEQDILADDEKYVVREDMLDGWGSAGISANLATAGHTVVIVPMQVPHLSPAMKWIEGLLEDGRLHHNGDPVAQWGMSNVVVKPDHNDNIFPRRQNRSKKIDPALALIVAACRARLRVPAGGTLDDYLKSAVAA